MKLEIRTALALAATAMMPLTPALAADYDPPIYVDQAPEYAPVEIGSGWYLRGDVGYNVGHPVYDYTLPGPPTKHTKFNGDIGVGYHFSDWLRGDVTVGYDGGDKFNYKNGPLTVPASQNMWSGLVNGYVDLGTYAGLTPYIGGGFGLLYSRHKSDRSIPVPGTQYKFAYALNAGASYKVSTNVSVDIGYQFLSSPSTAFINTDTSTADKGIDQHQIRVGLRYDLW